MKRLKQRHLDVSKDVSFLTQRTFSILKSTDKRAELISKACNYNSRNSSPLIQSLCHYSLTSAAWSFAGTAPWRIPLGVHPCVSCLGPATATTPVRTTGWARSLVPVCPTCSKTHATQWLFSSPVGTPRWRRWPLMLVRSSAVNSRVILKCDPVCDVWHFSFTGLKLQTKPVKVFLLPNFPPPLAYHYVQKYYSQICDKLKIAIDTTSSEEAALLAR